MELRWRVLWQETAAVPAVSTEEVAPGSELLVVKMGMTNERGFPRTTELMLGLDFVIREAIHAGKPVAVNDGSATAMGRMMAVRFWNPILIQCRRYGRIISSLLPEIMQFQQDILGRSSLYQKRLWMQISVSVNMNGP